MMPTTEKRTLLTVITEAALEQRILRDLDQLGVAGYTVSDARGRGSKGIRDAVLGETANIRIEIICARSLAETILVHIRDRYYNNFAMVTFLHDVEILRPEKF